jgi:hypothetical protein
MSVQSSEFQIHITTPAELSGLKSVEVQTERNIGKLKALGEDTTVLEERLQRIRQAAAEYNKEQEAQVAKAQAAAEAARAQIKELEDLEKQIKALEAAERAQKEKKVNDDWAAAFAERDAEITRYAQRQKQVQSDWDAAFATQDAELRQAVAAWKAEEEAIAAVARQLDELEAKENAFKDPLEDMKQTYGVEVPGALKEEAKAHDQAGAASERHLRQARLLHAALHPLAAELGPVLSNVLSHGIAEGFTAATIKASAYMVVIATAVEKTKQYFEISKQLSSQLEDWAQSATKATDLLKIQADVMHESALAANRFRLEMEQINRPKTQVQLTEERIKNEEELSAIKDRLADAEYNLKKARIEALFTDEVQKREALYALEVAREAQKRKQADEEEKKKLTNLESEKAAATKDKKEALDKIPKAEEKGKIASTSQEKIKQAVKSLEENIAEQKKEARRGREIHCV